LAKFPLAIAVLPPQFLPFAPKQADFWIKYTIYGFLAPACISFRLCLCGFAFSALLRQANAAWPG